MAGTYTEAVGTRGVLALGGRRGLLGLQIS